MSVFLAVVVTLVVVAAVLGVASVLRHRLGSGSRNRTGLALPPPSSRWAAADRTDGDFTVVVMRLPAPGTDYGYEEREVGRVANTDPDYDKHYFDLRQRALERAILLNSARMQELE